MYIGGFKQNLYPARKAFAAQRFAAMFGLVSLWRFEDGTNLGIDTYGTNNLANNNSATQAVPGKVGNGLSVASVSSQYLDLASNSTLQAGAGDFWISVWFNPTTLNAQNTLVSKASSLNTAATVEYFVHVNGSGTASFRTSNGAGIIVLNSTGGTVTTGSWSYIFAWYDRTISKRYIILNSSVPNASTSTNTVQSSNRNFGIGASQTPINLCNGSIDEVAFGKLAAGSLGDGSYGTLAYTISQTFYNNGNGLAWPW